MITHPDRPLQEAIRRHEDQLGRIEGRQHLIRSLRDRRTHGLRSVVAGALRTLAWHVAPTSAETTGSVRTSISSPRT